MEKKRAYVLCSILSFLILYQYKKINFFLKKASIMTRNGTVRLTGSFANSGLSDCA